MAGEWGELYPVCPVQLVVSCKGSGLQKVKGTANFVCPAYVRGNSGSTVEDFSFTIDGSTVAEMPSICYLGDKFTPEEEQREQ